MTVEELRQTIIEELARTVKALEQNKDNDALFSIRKAHAAVVEYVRRMQGHQPPPVG